MECLEDSCGGVIVRVLADRVGRWVGVDGVRFGLAGWMQTVFVVGQMRHLGIGDCIYCAFVDLEMFFGMVPEV